MSTVVICQGDYLAFCKNMVKASYTVVTMPLEAWVCREGLVIPLSTASYNAVRVFNGDLTGIPGQPINTVGVLLRMDGSINRFEFTSRLGKIDPAVKCYSNELPTGEGVQWATSEFDSYEEKAYSAMLMAESREEILTGLVAADLLVAKFIKWYKISDLVELLKKTHKLKYPDAPIYDVAKSFNVMRAKIEILEAQVAAAES